MTRLDAEAVKLLMLSIIERAQSSPLETSALPDDFNMLAAGIVDSLGFVELLAELERRLGVAIDLDELDPEHFGMIGPLSRYIAQRYGAMFRSAAQENPE